MNMHSNDQPEGAIEADLLAEQLLEVGLLRGQGGTEVPAVWPVGSKLVVIDGAVTQLPLAASSRGQQRHFRIGSARRAYDDPSYVHVAHAFSGVGLRPYAPVHLQVAGSGAGDLEVSWIRQTRIGGDNWDGMEVPLGEEAEQYLLRVLDGSTVLREVVTTSPAWTYSAADQLTDGGAAGKTLEVRQISALYGAGRAARLELD